MALPPVSSSLPSSTIASPTVPTRKELYRYIQSVYQRALQNQSPENIAYFLRLIRNNRVIEKIEQLDCSIPIKVFYVLMKIQNNIIELNVNIKDALYALNPFEDAPAFYICAYALLSGNAIWIQRLAEQSANRFYFLYIACSLGLEQTAAEFLDSQLIKQLDDRGNSLWHVVAASKNSAILQSLIKMKDYSLAFHFNNMTTLPVEIMAKHRWIEGLKLMLIPGYMLNIFSQDKVENAGWTLLFQHGDDSRVISSFVNIVAEFQQKMNFAINEIEKENLYDFIVTCSILDRSYANIEKGVKRLLAKPSLDVVIKNYYHVYMKAFENIANTAASFFHHKRDDICLYLAGRGAEAYRFGMSEFENFKSLADRFHTSTKNILNQYSEFLLPNSIMNYEDISKPESDQVVKICEIFTELCNPEHIDFVEKYLKYAVTIIDGIIYNIDQDIHTEKMSKTLLSFIMKIHLEKERLSTYIAKIIGSNNDLNIQICIMAIESLKKANDKLLALCHSKKALFDMADS